MPSLDSGPSISLKERDRRYATIRERLRERAVDCALVDGTNLFYLTNGLPGERLGVFPTNDEPIMVQLNRRHLADISAQVLVDAQDWVKDIRASRSDDSVLDRIKELRLENGTIGVANSKTIHGGLSHGLFSAVQSTFPNANIVDVGDIFNDVRTIKTDEEIAMIERANVLFDLAVERMQQVGRPGMTGKHLVQEGIRAIWEAGGDLESHVGICIGSVPSQNPIVSALSLDHVIQPGDIGTVTAHSEYGGYAGHSDQEIAFGEPLPLHRQMIDAVLRVRETVLKQVKPGNTHEDLEETYRQACAETGFRWSPHSQMHQYGIDVPEFPGPSFSAKGPRNFVLTPGMIYSISPTLVAPDSEDTMLAGNCLVITDRGYRELGDRKVEMLVAKL